MLIFDKYSTICDSCKKPITPFSSVGVSLEEDSEYPYVHLNSKCCPMGMLAYCGDWQEGKLLDLDEMERTGKGNYEIHSINLDMDK